MLFIATVNGSNPLLTQLSSNSHFEVLKLYFLAAGTSSVG